ncbi:potassium channel protein, TrkA family [[Synechococcus] sp. NIES-970]|uniref:potassium channel family protein n=1 Tax=Picosynechococcus sp. NKBG15041c TaxID=1407650 RepID=UPI000427CAF1|nr:potassium channel protein [Picosynechococcus sp. NKBG15041c]BAW95477.1 potassium channel protein, TrkA family [[Synechococcus] sp. NIES-970]
MQSIEQKYGRLKEQLLLGLLMLMGLFLLGMGWFVAVEHWSWVDAAYMTIITLATVGFGEIHPLGDRSRIFTSILILLGLIAGGYIVNRFVEAMASGYFQEIRRLKEYQQQINELNNHYIVCGLGRTGQQVAKEFVAEKIAFVVIDLDPERIEIAEAENYICIQGDATLDQYLQAARIEQAIGLVAALTSDAENLYTVLSAKTLNPKIRAIARASTEEAIEKLRRAGADAVVSPYITGGRRLAAAALRPQVMDFVDGILTGTEHSYYLEEVRVDSNYSGYVGRSLSQARLRVKSGALVLAIRRQDGELIPGPTGDTLLLLGDVLICMGTAEQLRKLNSILLPVQTDGSLRPPNR